MIWTLRQKVFATVAGMAVLGGIVWNTQAQLGPAPPGRKDINRALLNEVRSQATAVSVTPVSYGSVTRLLKLTGTIRSPRTANVSSPAPGQVQSVYVTEGMRITEGTVLATLDTEQADAQVSQARQEVAAAESAYSKALSGRELVYRQASGDIVQARLGVQEALAGQAKANAGAGKAVIEQAEAQARQAHAGSAEAADALKRTRFLFDHGVVPASTLEDVRTKAEQAAAGADAADAAVRQARQGALPEDRQLAVEKVAQARQGVQQAVSTRRGREAVADADVQAAATQVRAARAQLRLSQLQQSYTRITSPINGVVSTVRVHAGEAAMPGVPLFSITSLGNVYFETAVSETETLQLVVGQPAGVSLPAIPNRVLNGRVSSIVPVENPGSAGFQVRIAIQPAGIVIPPGANARATVQTGSATHVLVVPAQAVLKEPGGRESVYIVSQGTTARRRTITTGFSDGKQVEIRSGLKKGDPVVTVGTDLLHDGEPVTVQQAGV